MKDAFCFSGTKGAQQIFHRAALLEHHDDQAKTTLPNKSSPLFVEECAKQEPRKGETRSGIQISKTLAGNRTSERSSLPEISINKWKHCAWSDRKRDILRQAGFCHVVAVPFFPLTGAYWLALLFPLRNPVLQSARARLPQPDLSTVRVCLPARPLRSLQLKYPRLTG